MGHGMGLPFLRVFFLGWQAEKLKENANNKSVVLKKSFIYKKILSVILKV